MFMRKDIFRTIEKMVNGKTVLEEEMYNLQAWVRAQRGKVDELEAAKEKELKEIYELLYSDVKPILAEANSPMTEQEIYDELSVRYNKEFKAHPKSNTVRKKIYECRRKGRLRLGLLWQWRNEVAVHENGRNANTYSLREGYNPFLL